MTLTEHIQRIAQLEAENAQLRRWVGEDGRLLQHGVDELLRLYPENARLREALVNCATVLEALHASVVWELAPSVRDAIGEAVEGARAALKDSDTPAARRDDVHWMPEQSTRVAEVREGAALREPGQDRLGVSELLAPFIGLAWIWREQARLNRQQLNNPYSYFAGALEYAIDDMCRGDAELWAAAKKARADLKAARRGTP